MAGVVALAVVHFVVCFDVLRQKSPTVDEVAHLPAGRSFWERGDFRIYPQNPPLARLLAAAAVPARWLPLDYGNAWTAKPAWEERSSV